MNQSEPSYGGEQDCEAAATRGVALRSRCNRPSLAWSRGDAAALRRVTSCANRARWPEDPRRRRAQCHCRVGHVGVTPALRGWYTVCAPRRTDAGASGRRANHWEPRVLAEGRVRIGFLMGRAFTEDRHLGEIGRWLRQWGATADPLHLGDDLIDVAPVSPDHDLLVLKSRSDLAMSVAAGLHGAGAKLLNPYPVSALLRDRVVTFRVLRAAGVPVPETVAASHASQLLPALDRGPLIIKPYRRYNKHRPELATNAAELPALAPIEEPLFAQRYPPPAGPARTVSSIGSALLGGRRVPDRGACPLSPER